MVRLIKYMVVLLILAGCNKETDSFPEPDKESFEVFITLTLPSQQNTRATGLTDAQEYDIYSMSVLAFNPENHELEAYSETIDIITDKSQDSIKTFKVNLPMGIYDLVFLANSSEWITKSYQPSGTIPLKSTYHEIGERLKASIDITSGKGWDTQNTIYKGLIMYGETKNVSILPTNKNHVEDVFLSYSLAKVDVWVSGEASNNFKLKTVRVYCPNLEGFLFPGFYSADKINAANIYSTPIRYTLADEDTSQELLNTIYIFERMDNPTLQENQKEYEMLCLVVGGRFDEDLYTTYYRVDFKHKDDKEEDVYYPIQRNDHFLVNITKVKESGWPDEELAFYGSEKI